MESLATTLHGPLRWKPLAQLVITLCALCLLSATKIVAAPSYQTQPSDTLTFNSQLGATDSSRVEVWSGSDSNRIDTTHQGTINVSVTGTGFSLVTASSFYHKGVSEIWVRFHPTSLGTHFGKLILTSSLGNDTVTLQGYTFAHQPVSINLYGSRFDTIAPNTLQCYWMTIYNPNDSAVLLDSLTTFANGLASYRIALGSHPSLPHLLRGWDTVGFYLCVNDSGLTSQTISGGATLYYTDAYGVHDNAAITLTLVIAANGGACFEAMTGSNGQLQFYQELTDTTVKPLILHNISSAPLVISGAKISGAEFSFKGTPYPDTVAAGAYDTVQVQFGTSGFQYGNYPTGSLSLSITGVNSLPPCTYFDYGMTGSIYLPVEDSSYVNMFPDSSVTLSIGSTHEHSLHLFFFKNNGSTNVRVTSVSFTGSDSSYFNVAYAYRFDTIAPGGTLFLLVELNAPTQRTYKADLVLTIQNGLVSQHFRINATRRSATQGVAPIAFANQHDFNVSPNPSHGTLNIEVPGAREATIQVYNVLGALVASQHATSWRWNESSSGLPNGTYVVRVIGKDLINATFTSSKMIVIEH